MESAKRYCKKLEIIDINNINKNYFSVKLYINDSFPKIQPGQFVEILAPESSAFLRRPISIHDVNEVEKTMTLLIKIIGKGTNSLSKLKTGDFVDIIFPLGNGFSTSKNIKKALLIGGGCGMAPLLYLARVMKNNGTEAHIIIGGKTAYDIPDTTNYKSFANVNIMTENGELGEKGMVTQHSLCKNIKDFDCVYTCGPEPMMKAVAKLAEAANVKCEASLENMMACGIGVCLCCAVSIEGEHKRTCVDGPVFDSKLISKWTSNN